MEKTANPPTPLLWQHQTWDICLQSTVFHPPVPPPARASSAPVAVAPRESWYCGEPQSWVASLGARCQTGAARPPRAVRIKLAPVLGVHLPHAWIRSSSLSDILTVCGSFKTFCRSTVFFLTSWIVSFHLAPLLLSVFCKHILWCAKAAQFRVS